MTVLPKRSLFSRLFKAPSNAMEAESRADQLARERAFMEQKAHFAKTWVSSGRAAQAAQPALDADAAAAGLSCILPGLYLSGKDVEAHAEVLKQHGITHILQMGVELSPSHLGQFNYMAVPIFDLEDQDIIHLMPTCLDFIKEGMKGGRVLVHCAQGISRSASVVIAHVMKTKGMSYLQALQFVRAKRPIVCPNLGFAMQLEHFEASGCKVPANWETWSLDKFLDSGHGSIASGPSPHSVTPNSTPRTSYSGAPDPLADMPALLPSIF